MFNGRLYQQPLGNVLLPHNIFINTKVLRDYKMLLEGIDRVVHLRLVKLCRVLLSDLSRHIAVIIRVLPGYPSLLVADEFGASHAFGHAMVLEAACTETVGKSRWVCGHDAWSLNWFVNRYTHRIYFNYECNYLSMTDSPINCPSRHMA